MSEDEFNQRLQAAIDALMPAIVRRARQTANEMAAEALDVAAQHLDGCLIETESRAVLNETDRVVRIVTDVIRTMATKLRDEAKETE